MKKLLLLACVSACAASVWAGDPMVMIRDRAKETSQAVSAGQAPPSHSAAQPGAAPSVSAPPSPAIVAMQQNIASLAGDLAALQTDPSKKQPLINDLSAAAQGTSPSKNALTKIAGDLAAALPGKKLSTEQCTKLAQYLRAFSNSAHVPPAQQRMLLEDLQKILAAGGISPDDSAKLVADFKTLAAETK